MSWKAHMMGKRAAASLEAPVLSAPSASSAAGEPTAPAGAAPAAAAAAPATAPVLSSVQLAAPALAQLAAPALAAPVALAAPALAAPALAAPALAAPALAAPALAAPALAAPALAAPAPAAPALAAPAPAAPAPAPAPASAPAPAQLPAALPSDPNKLHAALMRARMLGDAAKVALFEAQLAVIAAAAAAAAGAPPQLPPPPQQHLKRAREEAAAPPQPAPAGPVLVSTLDARGRPIASLQSAPAGIARDDLRGGSRGGKLSAVPSLIGPRGERLGYFPEDVVQGGGGGGAAAGSAALAAEAARVRGVAAALARGDASAEGGEDMASRLARNIAGNARYRGEGRRDGSGRGEGEEEEAAGGGGAAALLAARGARLTERERQARDMARAVAAHREGERAVARCGLCIEGGALRGGCVVSRGRHCLLALPPGGQRFPGHLVLAPVAHVATATDMEEEVYEELNAYKAALHRYHTSLKEGVVFLETAIVGGARAGAGAAAAAHCAIHVVSMEGEEALDAPLYFRKALEEAEEWTTNAALIDTAGKGLRRCIPRGFSYFHVSWAGGGLLHPIESAAAFPPDWGLDVAAGVVGAEPAGFGRREARRSAAEEEGVARELARAWAAFDPFPGSGGGGGGGGGGGS